MDIEKPKEDALFLDKINKLKDELYNSPMVVDIPPEQIEPPVEVIDAIPEPPLKVKQPKNVVSYEYKEGKRIVESFFPYSVYIQENVSKLNYTSGDTLNKSKATVITDFIINSVVKYNLERGFDDEYLLYVTITPKDSGSISFYLSQQDFENKHIVRNLRKYNLDKYLVCSDSEADQVIARYISCKMTASDIAISIKTGFHYLMNSTVFTREETNVPDSHKKYLINKSFPLSAEVPEKKALKALTDKIHGSVEFATALTIHYTALLTSELRRNNLRFSKIIVANSDYDTTREFLDIYGNMLTNTLVSPGIAETKLKAQIFDKRDDILYVGEQSLQTKPTNIAMQRNSSNIDLLINTFCKGQIFELTQKIKNVGAESLCVVINGYITEQLPEDRIFPLDIPQLDCEQGEIRQLIRICDIYFVKWVCDNMKLVDGYLQECDACIKNSCYDDFVHSSDGYILKYVYLIMTEFFNRHTTLNVSTNILEKHLNLITDQRRSDKESFVISHVKDVLSNLILKNEIEIIHADKVFMTEPLTDAPAVYYQNNVLYFDTKLFDTLVAQQIGGVTSCVELKKQLLSENYIYNDNDNEYSVKRQLHGTDVQKRYTAVSTELLNKEAFEFIPSRYATFLQCKDDKMLKRIRLGYDETGRGVYWSINHPDMPNATMLVAGEPGCGKSSFVFQLVKSAAQLDEVMIYIDYNQSCTPDQFKKFGADDKWIDDNINYVSHTYWDEKISAICLNNAHKENTKKIIVITLEKNGAELDDTIKAIETDTILVRVLEWCTAHSDARVHVIIDEVNLANLGNGTVINKIITQRRKFGISLIMITPDIQSLKVSQRNTLLNVSTKVVFKQSNNSVAEKFAKSIGIGSVSVLSRHILQLKKFYCCISGNLEDYRGDMMHRLIQVHIDTV